MHTVQAEAAGRHVCFAVKQAQRPPGGLQARTLRHCLPRRFSLHWRFCFRWRLCLHQRFCSRWASRSTAWRWQEGGVSERLVLKSGSGGSHPLSSCEPSVLLFAEPVHAKSSSSEWQSWCELVPLQRPQPLSRPRPSLRPRLADSAARWVGTLFKTAISETPQAKLRC